VLWAKRTRRDAAAIRERRDWDEVFVETGQAREHLIAIRWKAMIDPEAELVLIDRLIVHPPIVVGGPCARRQRVVAEQRARHRVDAPIRDCVASKRRTRRTAGRPGRRRRWIVDGRHAASNGLCED